MQIFKKCSNKKEYSNYDHQTQIADILDKDSKSIDNALQRIKNKLKSFND